MPALSGIVRFEGARASVAFVSGTTSERAGGAIAAIAGAIPERSALDRLLETFGLSDGELLLAAFARFGGEVFARAAGPYAAAIFDPAREQTLLAVQPGAPIGLFVLREKGSARFSSDLFELSAGALADQTAIDAWIERGAWPAKERSLFKEIEAIPPGSSMLIEKSGRVRRKSFYAFSPFVVPRKMSSAEAHAEVDRVLGRAIARAAGIAEGMVIVAASNEERRAAIARHLPRTVRVAEVNLYRGSGGDRWARSAAGPIAWSALGEAAAIAELARDGATIVCELGARELFGETPLGRRALSFAVARAFEAAPGVGPAIAAVRAGAWGDFSHAAMNVLRRWSRHLPSDRAEKLSRWLPEETESPVQVAEMTGNAWVDQRFAEVTDASMHARLRACSAAARGRFIAPYLDPEVIETVFSLPPEHFLHDAQIETIDLRDDRRRGVEAVLKSGA